MIYCINPKCQRRANPNEQVNCQTCGTELLVYERYRLVKPLRELVDSPHTEVFEVENGDTPKVLKVLKENSPKWVELFQREAQALLHLSHPGIPKLDVSCVFSPSNDSWHLHYLLMEKIEGQNLSQWLEQHSTISQAQAIDWLRQLVEILAVVHQEGLLHRDIKPSNIMLKPNEQLVLIDFGTVREITSTYVTKLLVEQNITRVVSAGYTAPEQERGTAVPQSDFFALGRTFVHLLTGQHPFSFQETETGRLIWRNSAPQVSEWFADLIDDLMAPLPRNRPRNTIIILNRLVAAVTGVGQPFNSSQESGYNSLFPSPSYPPTPPQSTSGFLARWIRQILTSSRCLRTVLLTSVAIAVLVVGVRWMGMLQAWELQAYDQLLRLRPDEGPDPRLLIVAITEADLHLPEQKQGKGSLSDLALARLLKKLESYQPRAIGLDIYRDFPVESSQTDLATRLRQNNHLIAICKRDAPQDNDPGVKPPPEIATERQGFSDVVRDSDGILRRHLLAMRPRSTSACATPYALSARLAFCYLEEESILPQYTKNGELQLGNVVFKRLRSHMSGYQKVDDRGYQILLNYRSHRSPLQAIERVTLRDVLTGSVKPDAVRGRIILIGVTARSVRDPFFTPYSAGKVSAEEMSGVVAHAQMVSQIVSAVKDGRSLLWVWPFWGEVLWVWGWSLVGGILAWRFRSILHLGLASVAALAILSGLCFGFLIQGAWVPLVPSALALLVAGGSVLVVSPSQTEKLFCRCTTLRYNFK